MSRVTHAQRYRNLRDDGVVKKSEMYARWTLAQLMHDVETSANSTSQLAIERDYQSIGALLTNNLAAKLTALLFPQARPFFKAELARALQEEAVAQHGKTEVDAALARLELDACQQLFKNASYNQLVMATKHLIVTGNVLMYRDPTLQRTITYGLNQFACQRDGRGVLMDTVLREYTRFDALPMDVQTQLLAAKPETYRNRSKSATEPPVCIYTRIWRDTAKRSKRIIYRVSQEIDELEVGNQGHYAEHLCPWQVVTWNLLAGEHYGRGLVEDFSGDFAKLSDLSEAATLYGVAISKVLNLVAAGSGSDVDSMAKAEHGEWVQGSPDTVSAYEAGDWQKLQALRADIAEVFSRLSRAFMYSGNTRDAERVTAYELRLAALEVEQTLGGTYSALSESWQVPLAHLLVLEIKPNMLSGLVNERVKLGIVAGIPALGRSSEVANLMSAVAEAAVIVAQLVQLDKRIDPFKVLNMIYAGQSVDTAALFKSDADIKATLEADREAQEGQQQMLNAAGAAETLGAISTLQQQG